VLEGGAWAGGLQHTLHGLLPTYIQPRHHIETCQTTVCAIRDAAGRLQKHIGRSMRGGWLLTMVLAALTCHHCSSPCGPQQPCDLPGAACTMQQAS
jgi:hypothetical protein